MFQLVDEGFFVTAAVAVEQGMELGAVVEMGQVGYFVQDNEPCKVAGEKHDVVG